MQKKKYVEESNKLALKDPNHIILFNLKMGFIWFHIVHVSYVQQRCSNLIKYTVNREKNNILNSTVL